MSSKANTLCTSQDQCPSIPAEYFDYETITNSSSQDQTELLVVLTSFFGGYAALFIAFVVFTICRNKTSSSRYKTPLRLIIITITILIETFDVFTDIAQVNNVINGTECGLTSPECIKKDPAIGYAMIICVILGTIATLISLYTFCKTTALGMYDELDEAKYKKLDRCTEYTKIWGENVPMLLLLILWVFIGGGEGLSFYSFITPTFLIAILITAFNFYWIVVPLICCCCCRKNSENNYNQNTQTDNKQNMEMQMQPAASVQSVPVQYTTQPQQLQQPQVVYIQPVQQPLQQQPIYSETEQLPPGWTSKVDPNGRIYYQNDITQSTQWEKPTTTTVAQYAPTQPSDMAPMQQAQPIEQQFSVGSVTNENAVMATGNAYENDNNELSCCGKACVWCGAVFFTVLLFFWFLWSQLFVSGITSMNQNSWYTMSSKDQCILGKNFYWEMSQLSNRMNGSGESYPLWLWVSQTGIWPILETGNDEWVPEGFIEQDSSLTCLYTKIPSAGECTPWIFSCPAPYFVEYATDSLCVDYCAS